MRQALERRPPRFVIQIGGAIIFLLALSGILQSVFNEPVTALWATSGVVGVVIGLALQTLILDTFSGLAIQMERPFKIGDWINCHTRFGEYMGRVEETNWRTTRLWSDDGNIIVIPNSFLTTTIVTNLSMPDNVRRFELVFVLDFTAEPEHVIKVMQAAAQEAIGVNGPLPHPPPKVRVNKVSRYGIEYCLEYYLRTSKTAPEIARHTLITDVVRHIQHSGLRLAYPRQEVFHAPMAAGYRGWDTRQGRIEQLHGIPLFAGLDGDDTTFIAERMTLRSMSQGETVVEQDSEGQSMFILAEGLLAVYVQDENHAQLELSKLVPGDLFGEMSLLTGEQRSATVKCEADALICEITKETISSLIDANPDISIQLRRAMAAHELENREFLEHLNDADMERELERATNQFLVRLRRFFADDMH